MTELTEQPKPTIAEIEEILEKERSDSIEISPLGVIRKKIHLPEQPPKKCDCLGEPVIHTIECVANPEQPNTNLVIIKTIQGLMTCVNDNLQKLVVLTACMPIDERKILINKALEEIDLFERTTLYDLQKAFE